MNLETKTNEEILQMVAALKSPTDLEHELMIRFCELKVIKKVQQIGSTPIEVYIELEEDMVPRHQAQIICAVGMLVTAISILWVAC